MKFLNRIIFALSLILVIGFSALTVDIPDLTKGYLTAITEFETHIVSDSKITEVTWNFGDGTEVTHSYNYPVHIYKEKTLYKTVVVKIKNQAGETATDSGKVYIVPLMDGNTGAISTVGKNEHVWDLQQICPVNTIIGLHFGTGGNPGCDNTVEIYTSKDGSTWTLLNSYNTISYWVPTPKINEIYGHWETAYKEFRALTYDIRYIKFAMKTLNRCYMDYSLLTFGNAGSVPAYSFSANAGADKSAKINENVNFDGSASTGNSLTYKWDFESDGTVDATTATSTHIYTAPGVYTSTLVVNDKYGNTGTDTTRVTITSDSPVANAGADRTAYANQNINFDASGSAGEALTYAWDFETDGTIDSTNMIASHTYTFPGNYIVTLKITDKYGKTDTDTADANIILPTANAGPDQMASKNQIITFSGSASVGDSLTYSWDFETDGTIDSTGVTATHSYSDKRVYIVTLIVVDAYGNTATDTMKVGVEKPVANAGADMEIKAGDTVSFDASASLGDGLAYEWTFEDGTKANTAKATYQYKKKGNYIATLKITDMYGNTDTDQVMIYVEHKKSTKSYYTDYYKSYGSAAEDSQTSSETQTAKKSVDLSPFGIDESDIDIQSTTLDAGEKFAIEIPADADEIEILFNNNIYQMSYSASKEMFYIELETPEKNGVYELSFTFKKGSEKERVRKTITVDSSALKITSKGPDGSAKTKKQTIYVRTSDDDATCKYSTDEEAGYNDMKPMKVKSGNYHYYEINAQEGENIYYVLCKDSNGNIMDEPVEISFDYMASGDEEVEEGTMTGLFGMNMGDFTLTAALAAVLLIGAAAYLFILKK